jgi:hypothetical protein
MSRSAPPASVIRTRAFMSRSLRQGVVDAQTRYGVKGFAGI